MSVDQSPEATVSTSVQLLPQESSQALPKTVVAAVPRAAKVVRVARMFVRGDIVWSDGDGDDEKMDGWEIDLLVFFGGVIEACDGLKEKGKKGHRFKGRLKCVQG